MKVLYIVYWGAAEPLGQSLVLPTVKRLSARGADLTLVTFEKPWDLDHKEDIQRIKKSLGDYRVRWMTLRYHKRPKVPGTAFDLVQGSARSIVSQLRARPDIVHARTFVGGLIGFLVAGTLRAKLVYHNEGFYPDEQVDAGVWPVNSAPHRFAKFLERQLYSRADAVVALSQKAKAVIESLPSVQCKGTPVIVAPSCVDLEHFRWSPSRRVPSGDALRLVYVGSVGGRYSLDRIGRFVSVAARQMKLHLRILTRSEEGLVRSMLKGSGLPDDAWSVKSVSHCAMPDELAREQAGLHFLPQGLSEHGGSPTKIGEYWAAGLPVIVTPNAGDTDDIIRRERVGVIVNEHTDEAHSRALSELRALLKDGQLAARCRRAAEDHYALEPACDRQLILYQNLLHSAQYATSGSF